MSRGDRLDVPAGELATVPGGSSESKWRRRARQVSDLPRRTNWGVQRLSELPAFRLVIFALLTD